MPNSNSDTRQRILDVGKKEFLDNGYEGTSLRKIAALAGVTTGAIYGYFPDKAALFNALVEGPAEELMRFFNASQHEFDNLPAEVKAEGMHSYSTKAMDKLIEFVYDNKDVFKLIVCSSTGTEYADFIDRLVVIEEEYTFKFIEMLRNLGWEVPPIGADVVHLLCSANFHGMFQVIAHDIPREEGLNHIKLLSSFYRAGWDRLLGTSSWHIEGLPSGNSIKAK